MSASEPSAVQLCAAALRKQSSAQPAPPEAKMDNQHDAREALLPCPFCGCAAGYVKHSAGVRGTQGFDQWDAVACKHCRATVGACDRRFRCREDARDAWNRRATHPAEPAQPDTIIFDPKPSHIYQAMLDKAHPNSAQPERVALTDWQLIDGANNTELWGLKLGEIFAKGARFAEAMHGICTSAKKEQV
jgi:hypothetical protein